ncbi:tyrosine-protein phosphatase non-receptor type 14-like, partial [Polypterus senegalus]|uniref:tyrosine-protein phosphatase non-receptor type 14-like n=1 Tax=Polypterus senegalus TaxID=55291 RepID=UPI001964FE42
LCFLTFTQNSFSALFPSVLTVQQNKLPAEYKLDCLPFFVVLQTHYFGLWFHSKSQLQRWVELQKPLKKQLDKFGNEPLLFFGVMFYVPNVTKLEQEVTRYQYYLQVKKEVLEGRLPCSVEQGIRLAGLAVQADFGDFNLFKSQDFLREYELFPVQLTQDEEVLEELTQKVAQEHKSHCRMPPAEAELLYIKEVERLEGFGQETFSAKDNLTNEISLGVSFMGVFVRDRNGRSTATYSWIDIVNISHNKSAVALELANREETVLFHVEDIEMAKYLSRLFAARQKFAKENKICTELSHSPVLIRRRPTSSRSSLPKHQPFIMTSMHSQYGDHHQETHTSQDSIYHEDGSLYYRSQTSLDRCPIDYNHINGKVPNGSVYSAPSMNSLNHSYNFMQASPVSSNLSIPGSDIMRQDYIPSHRHSAIIVPSYRPTPEYETVMRQKRGIVAMDCHSQSLRNLNIGNTCAYSQPEEMVYSQPEIRDRQPYFNHYGVPVNYSKPVVPSAQTTPGGSSHGHSAASAISHTVSTPELANMQQQGTQKYSTAHMLRNHFSRPPPPYPRFRPATSTPDLASHRHRYVSGSSPELVTRKVQLSVKTFQQDSSPVVHQSLQEVSEPLTAVKHHQVAQKRHSLEVISSMVRGMEAMALKTLNAPLPRRNTLREQVQAGDPSQKVQEAPQHSQYQHSKTFSDATMVIHGSESEEDDDAPDYDVLIPAFNENIAIHMHTAWPKMPNKPPPEYPGPRKTVSNGAMRPEQLSLVPVDTTQARMLGAGPNHAAHPSRSEQVSLNGPSLGPSLSEPDLTSVKERVKKEPVKERPVSELFSIEDSIVEREIELRNLEKQKLAAMDSLKRPLMLAALNGLYTTRVPAPRDKEDDAIKMSTDERCKALERKLEEEMVFTEYEQILKKKTDGDFSTAMLQDNVERNRFRDVIPYEENRVELVPTKENNTGYINASHIKVNVGSEDWHYIATQGPLANTCQDFWQMVWEQGVNVIAMVTAEE